jgi:hypothetical protein
VKSENLVGDLGKCFDENIVKRFHSDSENGNKRGEDES